MIRIITTFDQARASIAWECRKRAKPSADDEEEEALEKFVLSAGVTDVPIEARASVGTPGLAASDFVQSVKADLLVVPLEKNAGGAPAPPGNIAWVTDVIPVISRVIR